MVRAVHGRRVGRAERGRVNPLRALAGALRANGPVNLPGGDAVDQPGAAIGLLRARVRPPGARRPDLIRAAARCPTLPRSPAAATWFPPGQAGRREGLSPRPDREHRQPLTARFPP
jgi:hypothetical protein